MNAFETESLEEAIQGSHLNATLLGRSSGVSAISRMAFPGVCLDTAALAAPMLFTGGMPSDRLTMIYVRQCPSDGHSFNFSTTHRSGVVGVFAPGSVLDAATPAGYVNATLSIPLGDTCKRLDGLPDEWLTKGAVLTLPPEAQDAMEAFLRDLDTWSRSAEGPVLDDPVVKQVEHDLIDRFLGSASGLENEVHRVGRGHLRRRYSVMRRVRDYLHGHPNSPVRVDELCLAIGISRRGLEYLFRDFLGIGVNAFIRHRRLHGARRAILLSGPAAPGGIKRIALDWGFWHLGRFSAEYKSQFGELPTATLARRTGAR